MSKQDRTGDSSGDSSPAGATGAAGALGMLKEVLGLNRGFTFSALVVVLVIMAVAFVLFFRTGPPSTIIITTGPEGSIFHTNALRYAPILARHGIKTKILTSHGSLENLERLSNPKFRVDVGFVQGGVTNESMDKLMSLGSVSYQPLMLFYRGAPMDLLSGLAGKRVVIGPVGSGTHALATTLLVANGIHAGGTNTLLDWEPAESSKALLESNVDAVFLMGEDASSAVLRQLLRAPGIHLFSFKQAPAYVRKYSFLSPLQLPQGSIDLGQNIPPQDVSLIGPTVELIARENLHPALSDLLLEAAREVHGRATVLQHKNEFPAPLEHDFRISPDATRFYKSGKSFFYRYLPFWLASFATRMVVFIIPMIVVLIPMLRSIPPLYRWRMRARIFRWYRALLTLERKFMAEPDSANREALLSRLDEIEVAVNRMKIPASFADQFYSLRGHIDFVRSLVEEDPSGKRLAAQR